MVGLPGTCNQGTSGTSRRLCSLGLERVPQNKKMIDGGGFTFTYLRHYRTYPNRKGLMVVYVFVPKLEFLREIRPLCHSERAFI